MAYNPTDEPVTARVVLKGAMLMCINRLKWCELGLVVCPKHPKRIEIRTNIGMSPAVTEVLPWPDGHALIFNVKESRDSGVKPDLKATGDYAFGKVLDLEGKLCHNKPVIVLKRTLDGRRVGITAGRVYSHTLTKDDLRLLKWISPGDPGKPVNPPLGKIAQEVGINIRCRDVEGAGIDILDATTAQVIKRLPVAEDTWYEIDINNDCSEEDKKKGASTTDTPPASTSDFRYFYDVVVASSAEKFDLQKVITDPTFPYPGICETVNLSRSDSLGLT